MKIETEIIASITATPIGRAVILMILYVEILKTDVFVYSKINDLYIFPFIITCNNIYYQTTSVMAVF